MLLSEFEIAATPQKARMSRGSPRSAGRYLQSGAHYKPQYWFINGLSFPNTIHVGFPSGYSWS